MRKVVIFSTFFPDHLKQWSKNQSLLLVPRLMVVDPCLNIYCWHLWAEFPNILCSPVWLPAPPAPYTLAQWPGCSHQSEWSGIASWPVAGLQLQHRCSRWHQRSWQLRRKFINFIFCFYDLRKTKFVRSVMTYMTWVAPIPTFISTVNLQWLKRKTQSILCYSPEPQKTFAL